MDHITFSIIQDLVKQGNPVEMISYELDIPSHDIRRALDAAEQARTKNILAEQLATRLPALLELSFKQLQNIILNGTADQRLRATGLVLRSATALAKLKHQ
jgi:hypothetical protein